MSDIQDVINFELLPNEIFIECLEYLNFVDIFYSFNQLNYRFNKLIRNIPLYLDFQNISQQKFHQFCMIISANPEIKKQVYSLQLSNQLTYYQIHLFLQLFSLDEFSNLRLLTLIDVRKQNVPQLKLMLPLLSQLSSFRLIDCQNVENEITSAVSISNLQTLIVSNLFWNSTLTYDISSILNLTINSCDMNELYLIFRNASRLRYLNLGNLAKPDANHDSYWTAQQQAVHLKQFIINSFDGDFCDVNIILKRTPNLYSLTINDHRDINMIDADEWQHLITSSLPHLKVLKFIFKYSYSSDVNSVQEKFKQFQNHFWNEEHHWYTEYSITKTSASIYTIPYLSNRYSLTSRTNRYRNDLVNNFNTFDNVIDSAISPNVIAEDCQYYFSHVTSLVLGKDWPPRNSSLLDEKFIESLKMIVNLSNVKHLYIATSCRAKSSSVLLDILKQTPQISSLTIDPYTLIPLLDNNELCNYLTKMIKKLNIGDILNRSLKDLQKINQIWKIFSDIEQLTCSIEKLDDLVFLLDYLPKLSRLNTRPLKYFQNWESSSFAEVRNRGIQITIDGDGWRDTIWITRDMYNS